MAARRRLLGLRGALGRAVELGVELVLHARRAVEAVELRVARARAARSACSGVGDARSARTAPSPITHSACGCHSGVCSGLLATLWNSIDSCSTDEAAPGGEDGEGRHRHHRQRVQHALPRRPASAPGRRRRACGRAWPCVYDAPIDRDDREHVAADVVDALEREREELAPDDLDRDRERQQQHRVAADDGGHARHRLDDAADGICP